MENSGKPNPKKGFKSPPEQRRKLGAPQFATLSIDFDLILRSILGVKFGIPRLTYAQDQALSPQVVISRHLRKI